MHYIQLSVDGLNDLHFRHVIKIDWIRLCGIRELLLLGLLGILIGRYSWWELLLLGLLGILIGTISWTS
ncbi:hypothetical protein C1645_875551 [Glomus cerebriforme]|uniref:Uncharacterized protein n=1 Tax=Glomus cerebriforme TaxID=658196 RepID=A0A397SYZ2_9GLOM|nr:hypothetical protein C1645_875551 [Glomus cerebriforme]